MSARSRRLRKRRFGDGTRDELMTHDPSTEQSARDRAEAAYDALSDRVETRMQGALDRIPPQLKPKLRGWLHLGAIPAAALLCLGLLVVAEKEALCGTTFASSNSAAIREQCERPAVGGVLSLLMVAERKWFGGRTAAFGRSAAARGLSQRRQRAYLVESKVRN